MSEQSIIKFKTVSGSVYSYDRATKRWTRLGLGAESSPLESHSGVCFEHPVIRVGNNVWFIGTSDGGGGGVQTSKVEEIFSEEILPAPEESPTQTPEGLLEEVS